jgi:hypothetical protein
MFSAPGWSVCTGLIAQVRWVGVAGTWNCKFFVQFGANYVDQYKEQLVKLEIVPSREWWIFRREWRNCLCNVLMSLRDGQRLGASDCFSVNSLIHGGVFRLGYRLVGRYVQRSATAVFSRSRSCAVQFGANSVDKYKDQLVNVSCAI